MRDLFFTMNNPSLPYFLKETKTRTDKEIVKSIVDAGTPIIEPSHCHFMTFLFENSSKYNIGGVGRGGTPRSWGYGGISSPSS